jgi:quercetin dioxygenase-like cupin family protein
MATNLSTCHPGDGIEALNRLPGLAEPLLQIDLERELQQLRREDSWQRETGRSSKTLAKYPDFRIVLILMKSGTRMRQHRAEGRISIQQLKGEVRIHLADRKVTLSTGQLLVLDCGVLHDVEALEESALLLTISWRRQKSDASESFSSTQRHLDEDAVSRMDDEGGAPGATVSPCGAPRKAVPDRLRHAVAGANASRPPAGQRKGFLCRRSSHLPEFRICCRTPSGLAARQRQSPAVPLLRIHM